MAKYENGNRFPEGFKVTGQTPLDDRTVVDNYEDLAGISGSPLNNVYDGLTVTVINGKNKDGLPEMYVYRNSTWAKAGGDEIESIKDTKIEEIFSEVFD